MKAKFNLHPRLIKDTIHIADLKLCRLVLMNDSNYPWFILIPRKNDIQELYQLSIDDRYQLISETDCIAKRLSLHFKATKMNVAALGNIVPQLHVHVIVRKKNDATWPNPIWNGVPIIFYTEEKINMIILEVKKLLDDLIHNE